MPEQVTIEVDTTRLRAKIKRITDRLEVREILQTIGLRQLYWMGKSLEDAGTDKPWQTMAASTIRRRPQRTSPRHFSSRYQALLQQSPVYEVMASAQAVEVGTNARYSRYHHEGASRGNWRLPARQIIPDERRARQLAIAVIDAIHEQVRQDGNV